MLLRSNAARSTARLLHPPPRLLSTATATSRAPPLRVTTLDNGVRVASDPTPGHFVAAGVYVDAGSRYESPSTTGAAHMTDRLAFKASHALRWSSKARD